MTNYEKIITMSIDDLADWLYEAGSIDYAPWDRWFNSKYCENCPSEFAFSKFTQKNEECAWCELNHKCKFFQDLDEIPNSEIALKMWLNETSK